MITHESSLESFVDQFNYVLDHYVAHGKQSTSFNNVVLGGLGGSGIGAAISKTWLFDKVKLPIEVINDYHLPAYASDKTLVVLNSYSGNTEETLSLYEEAQSSGCAIICLASGGRLKELAERDGIPFYSLPEGYQPRMTIGVGLGTMLLILGELFDIDTKKHLEDCRETFPEKQALQIDSAQQIFNFFSSRLKNKFVIVADRAFSEVAKRFTQQLNENSKLEGFVTILPEANHNVLESYTDRMATNFVMLYSELNERVSARFDFLISHLEMENNRVLPLVIPEYSIYSIFDVIYRLDWVSVMIANELGSDLMNVPNITNLKDFLTSIEIIEEE